MPFATIEEAVHCAGEEINDTNDFHCMDWKQDVGDQSHRIYEWWRVVMNEGKDIILAFQEAVRTVAKVQMSSAAVERGFS